MRYVMLLVLLGGCASTRARTANEEAWQKHCTDVALGNAADDGHCRAVLANDEARQRENAAEEARASEQRAAAARAVSAGLTGFGQGPRPAAPAAATCTTTFIGNVATTQCY